MRRSWARELTQPVTQIGSLAIQRSNPRVMLKYDEKIRVSTIKGAAKNIPGMPQIKPQKMRPSRIASGFSPRPLPSNFGSITWPVSIAMASSSTMKATIAGHE